MNFKDYQKLSRKTAIYNSFKKTPGSQPGDELNLICHSPLGEKPRSLERGECHKQEHNLVYPTLGLAGESGEVAEKVKKVIRDKNGVVDKKTREEIKKELGDVLWYVSQLATELDLSLDEVAQQNLKKLNSRMKRGKLQGSGDNR